MEINRSNTSSPLSSISEEKGITTARDSDSSQSSIHTELDEQEGVTVDGHSLTAADSKQHDEIKTAHERAQAKVPPQQNLLASKSEKTVFIKQCSQH